MNPEPKKQFEGAPPSQMSGHKKTNQETAVAPRFLIVKGKEGDFAKTNPFLLNKFIYGKVGQVKNLKKIRDGLLIETSSAAQSRELGKLKMILDQEVEIIPHSRLNQSRGVITCRDLLNCKEEEILEELKDQGVIEVKRMKTRKEGTLTDTASHILTFNTPKLPLDIKVAFYFLKVRPYIPAPLRCFRCQMFGHPAIRCTREQVCVCGKPLHIGEPCEPPISCVNCKGPHPERYRECPVYKQEIAIQEIKVKDNLTYVEAKKKVTISTPKPNISYSQAVNKPCSTTSSTIIDTQALIKELVPLLVSALQKELTFSQTSSQSVPELNIAQYLASNSQSPHISKRYRKDSSDEESLSSQTSISKKTKKGWPKGKPRKISVGKLPCPETPLPQETESL